MTEPIVLRSDAIKQLKEGLGTGASSSSEAAVVSSDVSELSASLSSSQITIANLKEDVVSMKSTIETMRKQIAELATKTNTAIEEIQVETPDAPTAEDEQEEAPVYTVDTGSVNTNIITSDASTFVRHYTYDNLHVVIVYGKQAMRDKEDGVVYDYVSFPDLSSYSGNGMLPFLDDGICMINVNGNKLTITGNRPLGTETVNAALDFTRQIDETTPRYYSAFWFDRSAVSKLFTFEDGALLSSVVSMSSPYFATHAMLNVNGSLSNVHFLHISTKTVANISAGSQVNIAQFNDNLSITTGLFMGVGFACSNDKSLRTHFQVIAPAVNTIAIRSHMYDIPANSNITINLIWIDSKTTAADYTVRVGNSELTTSDKFSKQFIYKHLNVFQSYGGIVEKDVTPCIAGLSPSLSLPSFYDFRQTVMGWAVVNRKYTNPLWTSQNKWEEQRGLYPVAAAQLSDGNIQLEACNRRIDSNTDFAPTSSGSYTMASIEAISSAYTNMQLIWFA